MKLISSSSGNVEELNSTEFRLKNRKKIWKKEEEVKNQCRFEEEIQFKMMKERETQLIPIFLFQSLCDFIPSLFHPLFPCCLFRNKTKNKSTCAGTYLFIFGSVFQTKGVVISSLFSQSKPNRWNGQGSILSAITLSPWKVYQKKEQEWKSFQCYYIQYWICQRHVNSLLQMREEKGEDKLLKRLQLSPSLSPCYFHPFYFLPSENRVETLY